MASSPVSCGSTTPDSFAAAALLARLLFNILANCDMSRLLPFPLKIVAYGSLDASRNRFCHLSVTLFFAPRTGHTLYFFPAQQNTYTPKIPTTKIMSGVWNIKPVVSAMEV